VQVGCSSENVFWVAQLYNQYNHCNVYSVILWRHSKFSTHFTAICSVETFGKSPLKIIKNSLKMFKKSRCSDMTKILFDWSCTLKTNCPQKIMWGQYLEPFLFSTHVFSSWIAVSPGPERNSKRHGDDVPNGNRRLWNSGFWTSCSMDNSFKNLISEAFCSRVVRHHHAFSNLFLTQGSLQVWRKIRL
jgi:hypothetical protein